MIRAFLAASFCLTTALFGQNPATPAAPSQVSFKFDRPIPGVIVPHYLIELRGDGTGFYHAEILGAQATAAAAQVIERPLVFTPATVERVFADIQQLRASEIPCASKAKNIADTGTKTLTYRDAAGDGSCTYNFSENKAAVQLAETFQGIELTLEVGRALDFKHRFDRLGLDAEMAALAASVEGGKALELGNIASTLRSIAADTELIQRVRLRAAKLLELARPDLQHGG